jgi:O-antigen/teichoic acid export membrane protein
MTGVTKQLKRLGKDAAFYGVGGVLQKFVGFLLFPIYTRVLTPAAYGTQDLVFTSIIIISYVLTLGLDSGTARHYYDAKTEDDKKKVISTYLWIELLVSIPICLLLIIFAELICSVLFQDGSLTPYFRIGVVSLPFTLVGSVTLLTLRLTFRPKIFSVVTGATVLVQGLTSVYLVVFLQLDVLGVFIAYLITSIFRATFGLVLTYQQFGLVISAVWLKRMLAFGVPLVPASLSIWILNYSNRFFLVRLGSLNDVGLISVGTKVASIVLLAITAFRTAWGPFAFSLIDDEALAKKTYSRVFTYYLLVTMLATVGLSVFSRELVLLLSTVEYEASASVVPFLSLSNTIWGAVVIVAIGYDIAKKSYHTTIAVIIGAAFNIGLNILLIPLWGIVGAAVSTMFGNIVALIYCRFAANKYFTVQYDYQRIIRLVGISIATIGGSMIIDRFFPVWDPRIVLYKFVLIMVSVVFLFASKAVRYDEIKRVVSYTISRGFKSKNSDVILK